MFRHHYAAGRMTGVCMMRISSLRSPSRKRTRAFDDLARNPGVRVFHLRSARWPDAIPPSGARWLTNPKLPKGARDAVS